jgi:hypothetical protein
MVEIYAAGYSVKPRKHHLGFVKDWFAFASFKNDSHTEIEKIDKRKSSCCRNEIAHRPAGQVGDFSKTILN